MPIKIDIMPENKELEKKDKKEKKERKEKENKEVKKDKKEKKEKKERKEEKEDKKRKEKKDKEVKKDKKEKKEEKKEEQEEKQKNGDSNKRKNEDSTSNAPAKRVKLDNGEAAPVPAPVQVLPVQEWRSKHSVDAPAGTPDPVQRFEDLQVPENLKKVILSFKHPAPTPIQAQSIPIALAGNDMIGIAETGSGKTLSFLIPAVVKILALHQEKKTLKGHPTVIVLAPTRELAQQIEEVARKVARPLSLRSICVYGGAPRGSQLRQLREGVDIVIATPGRLNDFIEAGQINLASVAYAVLDEADRMLDMGFEPQISTVLKSLPPHQTMMFSATWPKEVRALAVSYQNNPTKITIGSPEHTSNKNIQQVVKVIEPHAKAEELATLVKEIFKENCKMLVFTNTKRDCAHYAQLLWDMGLPSNAIHGDMVQHERNQALRSFTTGQYPILFATDVAARGLDVKGVEYVINVDFPPVFDSYVHRIGRTGRAGQKGVAFTLYTRQDVDAHMLVDVMQKAGSEPTPELLALAKKPKMSKDGLKFARERRYQDGGMDDSIRGWGGGRGRGGRGGFRGRGGRGGRGGGFGGGRGGGGRGGGRGRW